MKKVKISVRGNNNKLIIEDGAEITNTLIRIRGNNNSIHIGKNSFYRSGKIYTMFGEEAHIHIAENTSVQGAYLLCDSGKSILIGKDCMLATDIMIRTGDKHPIYDIESNKLINEPKSIVLGDHVWVARGATILKGVNIKDGCIVGAKSLVTPVIHTENSILAGMPAKVVKTGIRWEP